MQQGQVRASKQAIFLASPPVPPSVAVPTPLIVAVEWTEPAPGAAISLHGFADAFPVTTPLAYLPRFDSPPVEALVGSSLFGHGFAEALPAISRAPLIVSVEERLPESRGLIAYHAAPEPSVTVNTVTLVAADPSTYAAVIPQGAVNVLRGSVPRPPDTPTAAALVSQLVPLAELFDQGAVEFYRPSAEPPPFTGSPTLAAVRDDFSFPLQILAGSWIGAAGCFLIPPQPAVRPGRRSAVYGADSARSKIASNGRTPVEGSPNARTKVRGFRYG